MLSYLLRRIGFLLLTLILTSIIIFSITQLLPGDVARVILGREASAESLNRLREELGLYQPLPIRYLTWLGHFVMGDWGTSYSTELPIRPLVIERLGNSLMLAALILAIAVPLAVTLGVVAGLNQNRPLDNVISVASPVVVGYDVAGVVDAIGPGVSEFAPGDEVCYMADFLCNPWGAMPSITSPTPRLSRVSRNTFPSSKQQLFL